MKIILNIGTHGDERIGLSVAKEIKKLHISNKILTIQIANKKAFEKGKRFIDQDLNRSFPGKVKGNYEEMLAYKLLPTIKSADIVIDIHSTKSELKDTLIVTKLNTKTLACIEAIKPKRLLLMSATKNSALISRAKIGIGFEYGRDNDARVLHSTVVGIKRLLQHLAVLQATTLTTTGVTDYYNVTSIVPKPPHYKLLKKIKNYKLVRKGSRYARKRSEYLTAEEDFYPILFGEKSYKDYFGFKGIKMDPKNEFA